MMRLIVSTQPAPQGAAHRAAIVVGELTQLGNVFDHDVRSVDHDADAAQSRKGARQRFRRQAKPSGDQHLVVRQRDRAMALLRHRQRREKLGDPLHAALRLELFDLLHEMMHVLGDRRDHRQGDVGTFADAADDMIGRDARDARFAHRFGGRHIAVAGEGDRLREALAFGHDVDHGLVAGRRAAIKLHPAVDHDKKCRRRIVLADDPFVRPQHDGGRGRDDVLDGLRLQSAKNRDAGNDLKIAGRQF